MQVSSPLISRVSGIDVSFNKEMELEPRVSPDFELSLDNNSVLHSIQTLNFFQMKGELIIIFEVEFQVVPEINVVIFFKELSSKEPIRFGVQLMIQAFFGGMVSDWLSIYCQTFVV